MEQPGKVAISALGHRNREHIHFPFPVRALEFGFARRVRPSCPASACLVLALILNLVLNDGISSAFGDGVYLFMPSTIRLVPSSPGPATAFQ